MTHPFSTLVSVSLSPSHNFQARSLLSTGMRQSLMQSFRQYGLSSRFVLIGACCIILVLAAPLLFFTQPDLLSSSSSPPSSPSKDNATQSETDTGPEFEVEAPLLDSWSYVEVVQPDDKNVWPYRVFRSSLAAPPNLNITVNKGGLADGYLFLTPGNRSTELTGQHQGGPFIIGTDNEMVYHWFDDTLLASHDFRVQEINGEAHLMFWRGERGVGHGYGNVVIMDAGYQETRLSTLDMAIEWVAGAERHPPGLTDFHENQATSRATILATAYNDTPADLTSIGGLRDGAIVDSMIVELDIRTGEPVFTWSALDHVPLGASHVPLQTYMGDGNVGTPWDHFHINSIQDLPEGLLVSGRHTWSVYLVSRETGDIIWTLDGSGEQGAGDFAPLPEEGRFRWQHHARIYDKTENSVYLSLFDNHFIKEGNRTRSTRGLLLELPMPPTRDIAPRVVASLETPESLYSDSQGSVDTSLANGNVLVGHGPIPVIREYRPLSPGEEVVDGGTAAADLRWEARYGFDDRAMSYRAFKQTWHATPVNTVPSLVLEERNPKEADIVESGHGTAAAATVVRAYASWNGATDVEAWNIYAQSPTGSVLVGKAERRGFETVFDVQLPRYSPCVQVAALQKGHEVRFSDVVCV